MKKRQGHVSNSSSASFIIRWRYNEQPAETPEKTIHKAIRDLLGIHGAFNEETELLDFGEGSGDRCYCEHLKENVDEIIKATSPMEHMPGIVFETKFWIVMLNWITDFGSACDMLNSALVMKNAWRRGEVFEILRTDVVDDY